MAGELWTEAEKAYARMLRAKRWRRKLIAQALGKTDIAVKGFFDRDTPKIRSSVQHIPVPLSVFEARDQRANEYRSPAQIMLGDPSPLQSALGRECHD